MNKWQSPQSENEQDAYRRTVAELDIERRDRERTRHTLPCPDCGCPEGLLGWSREGVLDAINEAKYPLPREFYVASGYDPDRLYTICLSCNRADAEVLSRCTLLGAGNLAAWVKEDECTCVLSQMCAVCELTAKIERQWDGDNPLPF